MEKKVLLNSGWQFTLHSSSYKGDGSPIQDVIKPEEWYKATVPGTIHTDLFKNELIAEPFYADNELQLQWIGECDWIYRTKFDLPKDFDKNKSVMLVFEGLDTSADIFVNSVNVGAADNMFRTYKFDISEHLKAKGNILEVLFTSAVKYARKKEEISGRLPVELRSERVYIRKAQYSFGWDWGPCFITSGIWRQVYLCQHTDISIENILFETVQATEEEAVAKVTVNFSEKPPKGYKVKVMLSSDKEAIEKSLTTFDSQNLKLKLNVKHPKLWWPNGYGDPFLYSLSVYLIDTENEVVLETIKKVGLRTIKLIQEENGKAAFRFYINNVPIFAMGVNWIPSDSFLTRVDEKEYRTLLELARKANMNIIRVWGGGVYENKIFYDLCDEFGIMVWQDFMFACASYPETEEIIKNIKQEVEENVVRLQHHSSIAIWCGNNENEWIWYQQQHRPIQEMPGYKIFHDIIPKIVKKLDPERPYWPSTPFSSEEDPNSPLSGNRHQWDLWSRWVDYKNVKADESLFVTEFGFQGPANYDTLKKVLPKKERHPQSRLFEFHNKQVEGPERLYKFLVSHMPLSSDIKDFIYLTQLSQAFALKECIEHWRSRYPLTNGTIIWQLNDCWPVTSWSLIDSEQMPKLSYYFVKEVFKPQIACIRKQGSSIAVIALNNSMKDFFGNLQIQYIHLPKGKIEDVKYHDVELHSLTRQMVLELEAPSEALAQGEIIMLATLRDKDKNIIHRNYYLENEWKHLKLPKAKIDIRTEFTDHLIISTDKPVFFVSLQNAGTVFSQNGLIILPNEELTISSKVVNPDKNKKKITSYCLNDYLS